MGELLRDDLRSSLDDVVTDGGGAYEYEDPVELLRDLVALQRAIPEATILAADSPPNIGYVGYWHTDGAIAMHPPGGDMPMRLQGGREVSVRLTMHISRLLPANEHRGWVTRYFGTAEGRRSLVADLALAAGPLRVLHEQDAEDEVSQQQFDEILGITPEPEPRTVWERLLDDEPL